MSAVSVIMVSYHTGSVIFNSIRSVLDQAEVNQLIVVDNGNTETTLSQLEEQFGSDPRFQVLSGHGNIGFSRGCNLGASHATGDTLLLFNPDCIIPANGINSLLETSSSFEGHWLLTPRLLNTDHSEQQGGRRELLTPWMAFVEGTKLYKVFSRHPYFKRFNNHCDPCPEDVTEVPVTSGACMMLPRVSYQLINGMDERYFLHVEDIDFCLRFRKAGGKIYFCPKVSFVHALGTSEASRVFVEWHKLKGLRRYFQIHFSGIYPPGFIPLVNGLASLRFCMVAMLEGFLWPVRLLQRVNKQGRKEPVKSASFKLKTEEKMSGANSPESAERPLDHIPSPDSCV